MTTTPLDGPLPGTGPAGSEPIVVSTSIDAPQGTVWQAIADPVVRLRWWSYLQLEAVVGARWEEHWTDDDGVRVVTAGEVVAVVPGERLGLTWADEGWAASTDVEIGVEDRGGRTVVQVRHRGWERLCDGADLRAAHEAGWRHHLAELRAAVEG